MTHKYNWPMLVKDIRNKLFIKQGELAKRVNISQVSISFISIGFRSPGIKLRKTLLDFASNNGIDTGKYRLEQSSFDELEKFLRRPEGKDLIRIFGLYIKLSREDKKKFIRYAERAG